MPKRLPAEEGARSSWQGQPSHRRLQARCSAAVGQPCCSRRTRCSMPSPAIWAGCAPRQRVGLDEAPALGATAVGDAVKQEPAHLWEMLPDMEECPSPPGGMFSTQNIVPARVRRSGINTGPLSGDLSSGRASFPVESAPQRLPAVQPANELCEDRALPGDTSECTD